MCEQLAPKFWRLLAVPTFIMAIRKKTLTCGLLITNWSCGYDFLSRVSSGQSTHIWTYLLLWMWIWSLAVANLWSERDKRVHLPNITVNICSILLTPQVLGRERSYHYVVCGQIYDFVHFSSNGKWYRLCGYRFAFIIRLLSIYPKLTNTAQNTTHLIREINAIDKNKTVCPIFGSEILCTKWCWTSSPRAIK